MTCEEADGINLCSNVPALIQRGGASGSIRRVRALPPDTAANVTPDKADDDAKLSLKRAASGQKVKFT